MINHEPKSILNLFLGQNKCNTDKIIQTIYIPKSKKLSNYFIYKTPKKYNRLPKYVKDPIIKIYLRKLEKYLKEINIWKACSIDSEDEADI